MIDEFENIEDQLKNLKFKKKIFGGVDEEDVYKKLALLHQSYQRAFEDQKKIYQALIEDRDQTIEDLRRV